MNEEIKKFAELFDHTLLSANAVPAEFEKLCAEAREYGFKSVAVNSANIKLCREFLAKSSVRTGAAISFPLGQCSLKTKLFETDDAIRDGAQEIDYVCNIGKLKSGDYKYMEEEMRAITNLCRSAGVTIKVIFENCYLTQDEIVWMSAIAVDVRPDFIKTSTGYAKGGATVEDVRLMHETVGNTVAVKAAGGIRTLESARQVIAAGATRIGSSAGVSIINELRGLAASAGVGSY